jgi:hypothetical protein
MLSANLFAISPSKVTFDRFKRDGWINRKNYLEVFMTLQREAKELAALTNDAEVEMAVEQRKV